MLIIGGGPIGLEAALLGLERGLDVTLLEALQVGASLRRFGPTRLFSPLSMNVSQRTRARLGAACPPSEALLTGPEMVAQVLEPLARSLGDVVRTGHKVVALGRERLSRGDFAGHPLRAERPFVALVQTAAGERTFTADLVIDASGVYGQPLWTGAGGIPAPGERAAAIVRDLGSLHARLPELRGQRVLLVGHGHSAANAIAWLDALAREAPGTQLVWATRSAHQRPCQEIADDPLPERARALTLANTLASRPPPHLRMERRAAVLSIAGTATGTRVELTGGRAVEVDAIVSLTGYRPELGFLSELALDIHPATEGPAALARAMSNVTDCLRVPEVSSEDLQSGEPGFAFAGAKSYGRLRSFLLQTGLTQLEGALDAATKR